MRKLGKLKIKNYKSIKEQSLKLGTLNIFIGGNGVGKSNLISTFKFLNAIINAELANYVAKRGGADTLLYFGRKQSKGIAFELEFEEGSVSNGYKIELNANDDDGLMIFSERATYHEKEKYSAPYKRDIPYISKESKLKKDTSLCSRQVVSDLESYRVYHFHDTSDTAAMKGNCDIDDNIFLRPQAENLAAFLYWLKEKEPNYFANIEDVIRQIAPFFDRFNLNPSRLNETKIKLEWKEKGSDAYFNASALSDGTLRFICLATLLLQPNPPTLILLDEPELGLHPAAVVLLSNLLDSAATKTQIMVSTQSVTLVNQFNPEQVWTVDRRDGQSEFQHLASTDMSLWLEEYSLGELWEKNLLGARP